MPPFRGGLGLNVGCGRRENMDEKRSVVVGAGLVGSLWAIFLARRGYKVDLYEKRPDMRQVQISAGRSINLALSHRGFRALEWVGLAQKIYEIALPMEGRRIHNLDGKVHFQPYGLEGQAIYSVSRRALNILLLNAAEEAGVSIHFRHVCREIDWKSRKITFFREEDQKTIEVSPPLVFGCDGAFSACRMAMLRLNRFNYSQLYLQHGYKELTIPPREGSWALDPGSLHIWPRHQFMLIALPNPDHTFTCTLFLPFEGEPSFEKLQSEKQVLDFFQCHFPDALPLMPTLLEDFQRNPTSSLCTIRCEPWHYQDWLLLLGDAAHAIVPFYGQGLNAGFEDCRLLAELWEEKGEGKWDEIMAQYSQMRKPSADAISELAMENFIEMRDRVADPTFLLKKAIERRLHQIAPQKFLPLYSLVTFTQTPYDIAKAQGKRNEEILQAVLQEISSTSQPEVRLEQGALDPLLQQYLAKFA